MHANLHDQVHGDRFSRGNDLVESEWGSLGVKDVTKDGGECGETLFLIAVMMSISSSTHHSTEANKILLEIVHGLVKELCTPSAKFAFFHFHHSFGGKQMGKGWRPLTLRCLLLIGPVTNNLLLAMCLTLLSSLDTDRYALWDLDSYKNIRVGSG